MSVDVKAAVKKRLLTVPDVAAMCSLSTKTIGRLTDRRAMPAPIRLGRSVRYSADEIESWIAAGCMDLSEVQSDA